MHHYTEFFRAIRESIAKDNLSEMIELIEVQKKAHDARVAAKEQTKGAEKISDEESEEDLKKSKIDAQQKINWWKTWTQIPVQWIKKWFVKLFW